MSFAGLQQKPGPPLLNAVQIIQQSGPGRLTVQQLQQLMKQNQQMIHTSQPTIIASVTQQGVQAATQVPKVIATSATIQPTQIQQAVGGSGLVAASGSVVTVPVQLTSLNQGQSPLTAVVKPAGGVEGATTVQIHPSSLSQSKLNSVPQNVVVTAVQHTVTSQGHMPATSQVVVSGTTATGQTLQVTVPASSLVQSPSHHGGMPHVTVQGTRAVSASPSPITSVTLTPKAAAAGSPATATYTATPITISAASSQPSGEQVTILQRQPSGTTVHIQQVQSQPSSQTIQIQSQVQSAPGGQVASPQQGSKTAYSMRTRNQSKPQ